MPLIDDLKDVCKRLASKGWADLLRDSHGLDIKNKDLAAELAQNLPNIDRSVPGFEDFAKEGKRGIEPGQPARSLLYHALASPNVVLGAGRKRLTAFPTARDLEIVENYTFAAGRPSLKTLGRCVGGDPFSVVVFALEYRPGSQTCHRMHADLVFSRTGVARVGTAPPLYDAERRGFVPLDDADRFAMRVCPARYAPFLAVRRAGDAAKPLLMRFQTSARPDHASDANRQFWMPVHKLFPGDECLDGLTVDLTLTPHHVNEKLRRIHQALALLKNPDGTPFDTGAPPAGIDGHPFVMTKGIAKFSKSKAHASGTLVPVVHEALVEEAMLGQDRLTFHVPPNPDLFATSMQFPRPGKDFNAPEYVHIRTEVPEVGEPIDLNTLETLRKRVGEGNYAAQHYLDFTGDGWIEATPGRATSAALKALESVPAYSLVSPPDFFPSTDQRELTEWTEDLPESVKKQVWARDPATLSDQRFMPNLVLPGGPFRKEQQDTTATALVSLLGPVSTLRTESPPADTLRHSHMPDNSAGVFAPGWDVSTDSLEDKTEYMASYPLGSPFPEDAKLCAALSTFWPAAAPDATRTFEYGPLSEERNYSTVSPLTDEEIGQVGILPWDGVRGPRVVTVGDQEFAEYNSIDYADYVRNALAGKFSLRVTAHIVQRNYQDRVLSMVLVYRMLGATTRKQKMDWVVLSFRTVTPGDPESQAAQAEAEVGLPGDVYRVEVFRNPRKLTTSDDMDFDFRKVRMEITDRQLLFVDPVNRRVLRFPVEGKWRGKTFATL
jgi:hypothetical protein